MYGANGLTGTHPAARAVASTQRICACRRARILLYAQPVEESVRADLAVREAVELRAAVHVGELPRPSEPNPPRDSNWPRIPMAPRIISRSLVEPRSSATALKRCCQLSTPVTGFTPLVLARARRAAGMNGFVIGTEACTPSRRGRRRRGCLPQWTGTDGLRRGRPSPTCRSSARGSP